MIRTRAFLRAYSMLPDHTINAAAGRIAALEQPKPIVQAAIRAWIRGEDIDMGAFEDRSFSSLQDFFLRELRPGARPIGDGFVSPVDGCVVGAGSIDEGTMLQVKGRPLSVKHVLREELGAFEGGTYLTLFLRPRGYHHVHAPTDGKLEEVRWIPGRFFPQNEDALEHIDGIYERNERAVLHFTPTEAPPMRLVMVAASVVGGIFVEGIDDVKQKAPIPMAREVKKGDRLGYFAFGSTVIMMWPRGITITLPERGREMKMGEAL